MTIVNYITRTQPFLMVFIRVSSFILVNKHVLFVEQKVRKGEQKSKAEKNK